MHNLIKLNVREPNGEAKVSYSQFGMYSKCPKQWELAYVKSLREFRQSIHTLFGTAFHETLQEYLTTMYSVSAKAADEMKLEQMLLEKMTSEYSKAVEQMGDHFSNKFELTEFYEDGIAILNYIRKNRSKYFSARNEELVGIEVPIYHPTSDATQSVMMMGFLDVVIRDKRTDRIKIIDIKTSTQGWNKHQKADKVKVSQLVLYKEYFARQYGFDEDKIDILYLIVKRKLIDGAMFPQKRIQEFAPSSGKPTRNKLKQQLNTWITESFDANGNYITDRVYPPIAGKGKKNCKYCEFANREDLCPMSKRISE
jgi:hypothetical protein